MRSTFQKWQFSLEEYLECGFPTKMAFFSLTAALGRTLPVKNLIKSNLLDGVKCAKQRGGLSTFNPFLFIWVGVRWALTPLLLACSWSLVLLVCIVIHYVGHAKARFKLFGAWWDGREEWVSEWPYGEKWQGLTFGVFGMSTPHLFSVISWRWLFSAWFFACICLIFENCVFLVFLDRWLLMLILTPTPLFCLLSLRVGFLYPSHGIKFVALFSLCLITTFMMKQAIIDAASYVPPPPTEEQKKKIAKL